ncbi:MAG: asparagine synthase (glutamine-hydrolyzing) [Alicyclobacillus macrosporangiidus]|uniref:asparagine synthase (glutamine-hydrolyzing) n=1 Tax=Alicyclobacillus macrosporangiidus TaxID=392015 RepID=UPI0026EAE673|nr:asparagine synthase (glutamine-hydrolyzing) [Alicyclobacillus macrosporangiidus]MCL6600599.1 asparagine synthase (glutamine-hydrolyzing) [Alicyclobacillus macrosporangiidus]
MCGIAGWIDWERDLRREENVVRAMASTMACRGPDADGVYLSKSAAFGHRRLVVVDPAGGAQPMTRRCGERSYTMVYNGELYNTEDLRSELKALGYTFQSYSDTEVLLVSYIAWGEACVGKLNGIFAFAIWDEGERRLFMARDRLGVKPLFYARRGSSFLFASELKGLLAHPLVDPVVDAEGLAEVFAIGPARTPGHGIFKDVYELRPGHALVATRDHVRIRAYWKLESHEHTDDLDTTVETVRGLLIDTVQRQLVSDVPVCTFLSGGVDSSAVTAIAADYYRVQGREPLHTFAIEIEDMEKYFKANAFQKSLDAPYAQRVSEHLGTVHHRVVFSMREMIDHLLTPLAWRDVPGMCDIDVSMYLFCREIKRTHTVALTGEAADEVFGGYPWFHREEALQADTFPWSLRLSDRVNILSEELRGWIRPFEYVADRYREALAEVPVLPGEDPHEARVREIGYLSITRFLPTLLDRKDRMSMGASLEARVPFCDHRLVEYVFNVPWAMKACDGEIKGLLRRAARGMLPEDVLYRKKSPYPGTPNPEYLEATRTRALQILDDPASPLRPLVDVAAIRGLAEASRQPGEHRPWFGQILGTAQLFHYLLEIDEWMRRYHVRLA